jgi:hypothetical protein
MKERVLLGGVFLLTGMVCVAVTVIAAAWLDAVSLHERSAELQAAVQAQLQGKELAPFAPYRYTLSPIMLWTSFATGGYLLVAGFVVGVRSLFAIRGSVT